MYSILLLSSLAIGLVLSDPNGCCENNVNCDDTPWAIEKNGLYWAWASPCSGGCSNLHPNLPWGWRRATDAEFDAAKPFNSADFNCPMPQCPQPVRDPDVCAAEHFDDRYTHCDTINLNAGKYTNDIENGYWETIIVHEIDSNCPGSRHHNGCDPENPINCMDNRVRKLEEHFYPVPNAISYLEDYFNNAGESILDLDLAIRKLINGNTNGVDVTEAVNKYLEKEDPKSTRNSYNILEMDIAIYNLQKFVKDLEDKADKLQDEDFDKELFLLIKQLQCELSQLGVPNDYIDCRINGCSSNDQLKKMFNKISPNDGECPVGFYERSINNINSAKSLIKNPSLINNNYKSINNNNNNLNIDIIQKQIYILYAIIGILFTTSIAIFCYSLSGFFISSKPQKMIYQSVDQ